MSIAYSLSPPFFIVKIELAMIRIFGPTVPNKIYVACSGGSDSMFAASFLSQKSYRTVMLCFVNHGTEDSARAEKFMREYACDALKLPVITYNIKGSKPKGLSWEEYWRNERYRIFHKLKYPVVTAHHLDDCVETWVFTSLNGNSRVIPYRNNNVIRPFLTTKKSQMKEWLEKKELKWVEDLSNKNISFPRNRIRQNLMPEILEINPGIHTLVAKKVVEFSEKT